jgi:hypothetical protein
VHLVTDGAERVLRTAATIMRAGHLPIKPDTVQRHPATSTPPPSAIAPWGPLVIGGPGAMRWWTLGRHLHALGCEGRSSGAAVTDLRA